MSVVNKVILKHYEWTFLLSWRARVWKIKHSARNVPIVLIFRTDIYLSVMRETEQYPGIGIRIKCCVFLQIKYNIE